MTFVDPGARAPVNIEVKLRGGNQPFNFDDQPDYTPPKSGKTKDFNFDDHPDYTPERAQQEAKPENEFGATEAAVRGGLNAASFGIGPAMEGLAAAAGPDWNKSQAGHDFAPIIGGAKMIGDAIGLHPDPEVKASYKRGREAALKDEQAAKEQHPWAYFAGQLGGAIATPLPGVGPAANMGARALKGLGIGAAGAALGGAGEAISEGEDAPGIAGRALTSGAVGGALGGALGGIVGPRVKNLIATTPGEKAAETAADLGAPLPRGLTSDNSAINATTSKLRSLPIVGTRISSMVDKTQKAAGERIGSISDKMAGGATDRASADALVRPALDQVITNNNAKADALYSRLRDRINPDRPYQLPRTDQALNEIMAARKAAGWSNPAAGLDQFRNVAGRGSFNGVHRARVDARNAGNVTSPNPGYNAADFNKITKALTQDLRAIVHTEGGPRALTAFQKAEQEYWKIADQNSALKRLVDSQGEGAIASLLGSAKEQGGNTRLLAELKAKMNLQDFENVGGLLLHEIAQNPTTGEFSLAKFVTNWNKISDAGKRILFSPQHQKNIEDIVGMGEHVKGALKESNTSHTAGAIIAFDTIRDIALFAGTAAAGTLTAGAAAGAVGGAGAVMLGRWLASPAKAASISAWTKAYRGLTLNQRTPARIAAFNIATRNLANNLGVPVKNILDRAARAQPEGDNPQPTGPRPVDQSGR